MFNSFSVLRNPLLFQDLKDTPHILSSKRFIDFCDLAITEQFKKYEATLFSVWKMDMQGCNTRGQCRTPDKLSSWRHFQNMGYGKCKPSKEQVSYSAKFPGLWKAHWSLKLLDDFYFSKKLHDYFEKWFLSIFKIIVLASPKFKLILCVMWKCENSIIFIINVRDAAVIIST